MKFQSIQFLLLIFLCTCNISLAPSFKDLAKANNQLTTAIHDGNLIAIEQTFRDYENSDVLNMNDLSKFNCFINLRKSITWNGSPGHSHQTALFKILSSKAYKSQHSKIAAIVELCKKHKVDFNQKDAYHDNALHNLLKSVNNDTCESNDAIYDILNDRLRFELNRSMFARNRAIRKPANILMRAFIDNGMNIDAQDRDGLTAAHLIVISHIKENSGHKITTRNKGFNLLMHKKANIDIPAKNGWTTRDLLQEHAQLQKKSDIKYIMTPESKQQLPYYKPLTAQEFETLRCRCRKPKS